MDAIIRALLFIFLSSTAASCCVGQTPSVYPFYVSATAEYNFPGSDWCESIGDIEQVVGEDAQNYLIIASEGMRLLLPKTHAKKVSAEQAAAALFIERIRLQSQRKKDAEEFRATITAMARRLQQQNTVKDASDSLELLEKLQGMMTRKGSNRQNR